MTFQEALYEAILDEGGLVTSDQAAAVIAEMAQNLLNNRARARRK